MFKCEKCELLLNRHVSGMSYNARLKIPYQIYFEIIHRLIVDKHRYAEILADHGDLLAKHYDNPNDRLRRWKWEALRSHKWQEVLEIHDIHPPLPAHVAVHHVQEMQQAVKKFLDIDTNLLAKVVAIIQSVGINATHPYYRQRIANLMEIHSSEITNEKVRLFLFESIMSLLGLGDNFQLTPEEFLERSAVELVRHVIGEKEEDETEPEKETITATVSSG